MENKITKAQQDANNEIDQLRNLNDPQRQAEHNEINAVPDKTLDKTTIEQALNQLQSASEALHGEQKLQESKNQANSQIDRLESLNPGQVLAEKH